MIHIVIPVFNRWHFTQACLQSLQQQSYTNFKIVVVDHGSTDGTFENIKKDFPEVIVLKGDESMWWTAATNLGVRFALDNKADFVLTLNNDTIAKENYLEELMKVFHNVSQNTLIGSTALDAISKKVIFAGENENWFFETSKLNHLDKIKMNDLFVNCTRFPGRGLLIPVKVYNEIGIYDEKNFPHYLGDYEFTQRARKNDFKIVCSTKAHIFIYPEESGANHLIKNKTIKAYYNHLFGIRGGAQLKLFYKYAFRYCPWYALPSFIFIGTTRRILGYWFK